ncbi:MAG: galactitol-1-phosphate 5-dehydrogenase [Clostridia bacterium]|nr:galactitol-1-phosphate 5-dehydrogenase [Clostridia bacterium]
MKNKVKSANLYAVNDLRYEDTKMPEIGEDEVMVQVKSCGICGSDISRVYKKGTYHFPTIIGHEFSGKVTEDPKGLLTGKNVVIFPLLPCFECDSCKSGSYPTCSGYDYYGSRRDGGMTEYIAVKRWNLLELPENLSYDEGAMCEPVSVARHAVKKLNISEGSNVFISGAGPIGLIAGQWAKLFGAKNVYYTDIDERKLDFAKSLGFFKYGDGAVIDHVIEGTGAGDALKKCLEVIRPFGTMVLMGNPFGEVVLSQDTYWHILRKELKISGTWNSSFNDRENDWRESLKALSEGKINVKPLITHKFPLSKCCDAFEMMKNRTEFYNKVILNMNTEDTNE